MFLKQIAIIGGGIIGATAAFYLTRLTGADSVQVTLFDDGEGQATKAASGIISPWLSKRRNKRWYALAKRGAELIPELVHDAQLGSEVYEQTGTIVTRKSSEDLKALYTEAKEKAAITPAMGEVQLLSAIQVGERLPFLTTAPEGVFVSSGAKIDGAQFVNQLLDNAQAHHLKIVHGRAKFNSNGLITCDSKQDSFDRTIVATGAWMKATLAPLGLNLAVRPQKGQLIEISVHTKEAWDTLPVMMPEGSSDIIPFAGGKLVIGATHEDDQQFDLTPTKTARDELLANAGAFISSLAKEQVVDMRVGTRAYTPDFGPFFGQLPTNPAIAVGGGLGSSGLTTGPIIGYLLAKSVLGELDEDLSCYTKPVSAYLTNL